MPEPTTDRPPRSPAISPARVYAAAALLCAVAIGLTSLHARQAHRGALAALAAAWGQAGQAIEAEAKAGEIADRIRAISTDLERHRRLRPSIDLSAVTATLINRLPETATLDHFELTMGVDAGRRVLHGDAAGCAPSLAEAEVFAARLEQTLLFDEVRVEERLRHASALDGAIGFGVTFRVDLEEPRAVLSAGNVDTPWPEGSVR